MTTPAAPPTPVRIPADVDRADRVLAGLTARQLLLLGLTGLLLYGTYLATRAVIPVAAFLAVAIPIAVSATALALGVRDGLSLDRLLVAAMRQRLAPRVLVAAPEGLIAPPESIATTPASEPGNDDDEESGAAARVGDLAVPARAVCEVGVVDLGADGFAVIAAVSTLNFALQTTEEQELLGATFGRYLHSLTAPVQVLVRAQRLDLSAHIDELRERAGGLPHPALDAAARAHADFVAELAATSDLLRRQVLLVLREPRPTSDATRWRARLRLGHRRDDAGEAATQAATARLGRRVDEAATLLAAAGLRVKTLDARDATAILTEACNPATLIAPTADIAAADDVITRTGTPHLDQIAHAHDVDVDGVESLDGDRS